MSMSPKHIVMRSRHTAFWLASLAVTLLGPVAGCELLQGEPAPKSPSYRWGMFNATGRLLGTKYSTQPGVMVGTEVTYVHEGQQLLAVLGGPAPGGETLDANGVDPIPDVVHVVWVYDDDRSVHAADLPVHGHIPDEANFRGTLFICLTEAGPRLVPETVAQSFELTQISADVTARLRDQNPRTRPELGPDRVWRSQGRPVNIHKDGTYD